MEVLVRDIIKKAEEKLKEAGVVDFAVDSWLLAEFVFKINRTGFYMDPMMTVSKRGLTNIWNWLELGHQKFLCNT